MAKLKPQKNRMKIIQQKLFWGRFHNLFAPYSSPTPIFCASKIHPSGGGGWTNIDNSGVPVELSTSNTFKRNKSISEEVDLIYPKH